MLLSVLGAKATGLLAAGMPTITGLLDTKKVTENANWSIGTFLENAQKALIDWGGALIALIGVVLIIWAGVQIARGLISHGKTQISWPVNIIMLIVGGAFLVGGFTFLSDVASGGKRTLEDLSGNSKAPAGEGTIMMVRGLLAYLGL